jgi:hypothetical protein
MSSAVEEHVIYQVSNAPMREYPYPHIYVENVFPADFYAQLRANWPDASALVSIPETGRVSKGMYAERFVLPFNADGIMKLPEERREFWIEFGNWFMTSHFLGSMVAKFDRYVRERFGDEVYRYSFEADSLVVRDLTNYAIGPHTDAPHRLLSMLFYCPHDDSMKHLGTSIYVPLDREFRCEGGPHYPHNRFQKVMTMEYKPNSLCAFFKNDHSFHGVEPISDRDVQRDVLLYDIRVLPPKNGKPDVATPRGMGLKILQRLFSGSQK